MLIQKIKHLQEFAGEKVSYYLVFAFLLGLATFFMELSFVYILQGFLISMNIMDAAISKLPEWWPTGSVNNAIILTIFGFFKFVSNFLLTFIQGCIPKVFERNQRAKIIGFSLFHPDKITLDDATAAFSDLCINSARVLNNLTTFISHSILGFCLFLFGLNMAPKEMILGISLTFILALPLSLLNKKIKSSGEGIVQEWKSVLSTFINGIRHNFILRIYGLVEEQVKASKETLNSYNTHFYTVVGITCFKNNVFP